MLLVSGACTAGWELQWIDRFDGNGVNWDHWTAQTAANYNNEVQCYTDDDSSPRRNYEVSDGTLKIIARKGAVQCPGLDGETRSWTSGRLNSKDKREFLYGRLEARIRFHNLEAGTWPAFWMLENRIEEQPIAGDDDTVAWPNPGASEIDVWEWFSNEPQSYITNFFNVVGAACGREARHAYPGGAADVLDWHVYAIDWSVDEIRFLMDGEPLVSYDLSNCPVYEEPMFVLLNLALGGNLGGEIDPDLTRATLEVDYVAHCTESASSTDESCNESTAMAFAFDRHADGLWVADDPGYEENAQGLSLDFLELPEQLFVAWFTYLDDATGLELDGTPGVGAPDNRWLTGQLATDGAVASGTLYASSGGRFDAPPQPGQETVAVGNMTIRFDACDHGDVQYRIDPVGLERSFAIIPLEKRVSEAFQCAAGPAGP